MDFCLNVTNRATHFEVSDVDRFVPSGALDEVTAFDQRRYRFDVGGLGVQPIPQSFSTFCENQQEGEISDSVRLGVKM